MKNVIKKILLTGAALTLLSSCAGLGTYHAREGVRAPKIAKPTKAELSPVGNPRQRSFISCVLRLNNAGISQKRLQPICESVFGSYED